MNTTWSTGLAAGHELSRRRFLAGAAGIGIGATSAGVLLSGCTGGGGASSDLRSKTVMFDLSTGRVTTPTLMNPLVPGTTQNQGLLQALMEPLFMLNLQTGKVLPWLGTRFEPNDDYDVWTLTLRDGVTWSDGKPFTADDVVFSVRLLTDGPAELLKAAQMRTWVKAVEKVNARTVRFELKQPNPRFQLDYFSVKITDSVPILPRHIWKGKDPLKFTNYDKSKAWPVFTGPYALKSVSPTQFVYERRADWWGAKVGFKPLPRPERLVWVANETEEARVQAAVNHQMDSLADITTGAFESLKKQNPDVVAWQKNEPYSWVDPCVRLFSFNLAVDPWGDKDVRWAMNHLINRDDVVKIAYEGSTSPARFFFPAYPPLDRLVNALDREGLFDKFPLTRYDPARADELLTKKGYRKNGQYYAKDGKQLRLQIDTISDIIELKRIAQVLVEQLQRGGVNATMRSLSFSTWAENLALGKFEAATDFSACGSVSEPYSSMWLYVSRNAVAVGKRASSNSIRWRNPEYTRYVDQLATLPADDPRVEGLFVKAARVWLADLPFIPVTQAKKLVPFDTYYWQGWPTAADDYIQPGTWWQSTHEIIHRLKPVKH